MAVQRHARMRMRAHPLTGAQLHHNAVDMRYGLRPTTSARRQIRMPIMVAEDGGAHEAPIAEKGEQLEIQFPLNHLELASTLITQFVGTDQLHDLLVVQGERKGMKGIGPRCMFHLAMLSTAPQSAQLVVKVLSLELSHGPPWIAKSPHRQEMQGQQAVGVELSRLGEEPQGCEHPRISRPEDERGQLEGLGHDALVEPLGDQAPLKHIYPAKIADNEGIGVKIETSWNRIIYNDHRLLHGHQRINVEAQPVLVGRQSHSPYHIGHSQLERRDGLLNKKGKGSGNRGEILTTKRVPSDRT